MMHQRHWEKVCKEQHQEIERLQSALRPFADAVYNDNGDMSIYPVLQHDPYVQAYFALKGSERQ